MDPYEELKKNTKRYKKIKKLLKATYGYKDFRPKQYEIINKIISKKDVCAILPTSHGKTLTYQLPAIYLEEPAIIISPLISLMDDQQYILEELGITSCCYNSNVQDKKKMRKDILKGEYQFIYITPESIGGMGSFLKELEETQGISLIAIDEAHCISSYGHDFRKAYRELTFLKEVLPEIPILAVTATATTEIGKDICNVLNMNTKKPIKISFDRPNLYIEVRKKSNKIEKDIVPIVKKYPDKPIIIYCISRKETEKVADILKIHKFKAGVYHAGIESDEKTKTHHRFIKGKINIVVATIAFGMGINKSDVRVIIHYGSPRNIEGYYQEIGRAGRDGKKAYCYAFYNGKDFIVQEHFISQSNNEHYQKIQRNLLDQMKTFMRTQQCRRKLLLNYFDEETKDKCNFCDNCCGINKTDQNTVEQNIQKETKMLIGLIKESIINRDFGMTTYINILRGSNNKAIPEIIKKKSKYYGKGKHKSMDWWKELGDNLLRKEFLKQVHVKGRFAMQIIKVTEKGTDWEKISGLDGFLGGLGTPQLGTIKMSLVD